MTDSELLALVRGEATKFGRCCDLYQDGFGTFADRECQQRTFAMLHGVQQVLGVDKGCLPRDILDVSAARARARLNNAAPDLLAALRCFLDDPRFQVGVGGNPIVVERMIDQARAAYAKATGE